MSATQWSFGDRIIHAKRPEWGVGVVTAAQTIQHEGQSAQRLTIRFDRAGLKTITTAMAELCPATDGPALAPEPTAENPEAGWLENLEGRSPEELLCRLPEAATDPFSTPAARLQATLNLFRFSDSGGSLLDWAAAQTGMKDPLSRFNRHELESHFKRFAFSRDDHLKALVMGIRKKDPALIAQAAKSAPPAAQQALRRLDGGR
ncbi:MAG: DUF3553 domain-containing protein [Phycisphaerales bacterium]|nr:DUF3553 domain-containing protein [Phycisphaerales bacterium]